LIASQYQLDKRTDFKPGESYRVGEMIATVHADKASMLRAIAAVDAKRKARHALLREKAIDIMLMSPEELAQFKIKEWLEKNKQKDKLFKRILGRFAGKPRTDYMRQLEIKHAELPPDSNKSNDEEEGLIKAKVKIKETVH